MHIGSTGVYCGQKSSIVCSGEETKNLYPTFISGSSGVATVFAYTCTLTIS